MCKKKSVPAETPMEVAAQRPEEELLKGEELKEVKGGFTFPRVIDYDYPGTTDEDDVGGRV